MSAVIASAVEEGKIEGLLPPLEELIMPKTKDKDQQKGLSDDEGGLGRLVRKVDDEGRSTGIGRRKTSLAHARVCEGSGSFTVNGLPVGLAFPTASLVSEAIMPLVVTNRLGLYDVVTRVRGGGTTGQAGAIRLAVARALTRQDPEVYTELKQHSLYTRDPRMVERKKPGKAKARKSFAWVKR